MEEYTVCVFFYGSFLNIDILKKLDLESEEYEISHLYEHIIQNLP